MEISGASSAYGTSQTDWLARRKERKQDFSDLAEALNSGDLSAAKTAYSALRQVEAPPPPPSGGKGKDDAIGADAAALGQALQTNDVTDAQSALAKLQQDMQALQAQESDGSETGASDRDKEFQTLVAAINSGDLASAQTAFAALQQQGGTPPPPPPDDQNGTAVSAVAGGSGSSTGATSSTDTIGADMSALGKALDAGNLDDAKSALEKVQQDMKAAHAGHGHHHRRAQATQDDGSQTQTFASLLSASLGSSDSTSSTDSTDPLAALLAALGKTASSNSGSSVSSLLSSLFGAGGQTDAASSVLGTSGINISA